MSPKTLTSDNARSFSWLSAVEMGLLVAPEATASSEEGLAWYSLRRESRVEGTNAGETGAVSERKDMDSLVILSGNCNLAGAVL